LYVTLLNSGPSPGFSSWGGQKPVGEAKNQKGGHIFEILYWMYAATRGPNAKWGAQISNGGPGTTAPPLATTLIKLVLLKGSTAFSQIVKRDHGTQKVRNHWSNTISRFCVVFLVFEKFGEIFVQHLI